MYELFSKSQAIFLQPQPKFSPSPISQFMIYPDRLSMTAAFLPHDSAVKNFANNSKKIPFGSHRQPLQWLDSIEKISLLEIEMIRVPIMHPGNLVSGRVSHEVQEECFFIHHSRVGIEFGHLMGFVEFALRVALPDDVTHDLLVTAMVPEVGRAFFQREAIRILQDLL